MRTHIVELEEVYEALSNCGDVVVEGEAYGHLPATKQAEE